MKRINHPGCPCLSRRLRLTGYVARTGDRKGAYRVLMRKPERRRPLGRSRHRSEDNIKIDVREVGWEGMDWIDLAQNRDRWRALVNAAMNLWVPQYSGNFLTVSFSAGPLPHGVSNAQA